MSGADHAAMQQDPRLADTFRLVLEAFGNRLRVAMPGKILAYDPETHKATVQPLIKYQKEGGSPRDLAPIGGVPVAHPRSVSAGVYLPLKPGDLVTLLVSDRDLSNWKAGSGQSTMPTVMRAHNLADCWAFPGGYPDGLAPKPRYPNSLEVWLAEASGVTQPGTLAITNGQDDLIELLVQFIDLFINGNLIGNLGYPTSAGPAFAILRQKLEAFKDPDSNGGL